MFVLTSISISIHAIPVIAWEMKSLLFFTLLACVFEVNTKIKPNDIYSHRKLRTTSETRHIPALLCLLPDV